MWSDYPTVFSLFILILLFSLVILSEAYLNWNYRLVVPCLCTPVKFQFTSMSVHTHIINSM